MARQQQQQLFFDWTQSGLPAAPLSAAKVPEAQKTPPSPFNFKERFPPPRAEAIGAGVFGTEECPDEQAVRAIHEEHAKELLAVLLDLDALDSASVQGVDPRTGTKPRTDAGREKLQRFFRTEPVRLDEHFRSLMDVYADGFGQEAAAHFEAFIRATHESRDFETEPLSHSPMPVPVPLPEAVEKGNFGMADEQTPVDPLPEEVFSLTEHHGERIVDLLEELKTIDEQLGAAAGEERQRLIAQKDKALCAYQGALALYAEDFGDAATRQLDAWARSQLGVPSQRVKSTPRIAQSAYEPYAGIGSDRPIAPRTLQYDPGHPWFYLARGDGQQPVPLSEIPARKCDGRFIDKLPKDPAKRRVKLERLLADEVAHLAGYELNYTDLIKRGGQALSEYDRNIAYGGDEELAVASSLALRFNHIAHCRGRVRWLQAKLGLPLEFSSPVDSSESSAGVRNAQDASSSQDIEQAHASATGPFPSTPLRHDLASSSDACVPSVPDTSPGFGSPHGKEPTPGGPMQTDIARTESGQSTRSEKLEKLHDTVEQAIDQLAASLEAGQSDTLKSWLKTMSRFHSYSLNNQMLIAWQRPDATHVAGFHAWKRFNRLVNKGEKGIMILAPVTRTVGTRQEQDEQGIAVEKPVRAIVNTKIVYVFDVSQTHGDPLPELNTIKGEPAAYAARIKDFIAGKGIELEFAANLYGALGRSEGGKISVLQGLSPAEEFHVLAHEVAHELLHRGDRRNETTRQTRELEAEAVAFVVCNAVGLDAKGSSTDYIHLYRGNKQMLHESLSFIRKTAGEIIAFLIPQHTTED